MWYISARKGIVRGILFLLCAAFLAVILFAPERLSKLREVTRSHIEPFADALVEFVSEGLKEGTPGPLKRLIGTIGALTGERIVGETNRERIAAGLPALSRHVALDTAARGKVTDMFARQYFEHEAPDGTGVAELIEASGYEYIVVGENLAMGRFLDDADVVRAWMESPGHRANILNERFGEIGVAAVKGTFEGKTVWIAVQEFGRPRALCPSISLSLKNQIDHNQEWLVTLERELDTLQSEMERTRHTDRERYNTLVPVYNEKVREYNALVRETKSLVVEYNSAVRAFNSCIE